MSKSSFFTGQPVFNQILNFIPRASIDKIVAEHGADRYYKKFKTYDHLVTMLYTVFNQCTGLREVTTGLLAWEHRIGHLGIQNPPRRSTIDRKSTRLNSSHVKISYAVFCLKKKKRKAKMKDRIVVQTD